MARQATLYRMVTPEHICPFGLKTRDLLKRKGFKVEDHQLTSREETDRFKAEHSVQTTPQVFLGQERIGGYTDLKQYLGVESRETLLTRNQPVIAVFATTLLLALAASHAAFGSALSAATLPWFIALSMCVLAILKLRDLSAFSSQFIVYDLLGMRVVRYAYVYPFAEAFAGIGMLAGFAPGIVAAVALFIGSIGTASVIKAVYIDRRELKCACVGGNSTVPLGFISMTENLMMVGMGLWMLLH